VVHRGFREVASAAAAERRSAAMLRRLSSFLADASLSARQTDAEVEVLHLVAEHARELTDAIYASATCSAYGKDVRARSLDLSTAEAEPEVLERLEAVGKLLPTRLSRIDWPAQPALRDVPPSNALSVPLTALDGEPIGLLLLVEKRTGEFTVVDEAVAVHLAEMTAAALERVELYRSPARG
jgi:GAF domain-containing protein